MGLSSGEAMAALRAPRLSRISTPEPIASLLCPSRRPLLLAARCFSGPTMGRMASSCGSTITWRLPGASYLQGRDFSLRLRLPDVPLWTRLPVTLRLTATKPDGQTSSNVVQMEVMVAELRYLPVTR